MISREDRRLSARLRAHYANDVWEHRREPPSDWDRPLPDHLAEAAEESHLRRYAEALRKGEESAGDQLGYYAARMQNTLPKCVIL